jgi:SAM-dependent methyltransferase
MTANIWLTDKIPRARYPSEIIIRALSKFRPSLGYVLDVGCGIGAHIGVCLDFNAVGVHAVDLDHRCVDHISRAWSSHSPVKAEQADLETASFGENRYTTIIDSVTLCHLPAESLPGALTRLHLATFPGGRIITTYFIAHLGSLPCYTNYTTTEEREQLMSVAGWKVIEKNFCMYSKGAEAFTIGCIVGVKHADA